MVHSHSVEFYSYNINVIVVSLKKIVQDLFGRDYKYNTTIIITSWCETDFDDTNIL